MVPNGLIDPGVPNGLVAVAPNGLVDEVGTPNGFLLFNPVVPNGLVDVGGWVSGDSAAPNGLVAGVVVVAGVVGDENENGDGFGDS